LPPPGWAAEEPSHEDRAFPPPAPSPTLPRACHRPPPRAGEGATTRKQEPSVFLLLVVGVGRWRPSPVREGWVGDARERGRGRGPGGRKGSVAPRPEPGDRSNEVSPDRNEVLPDSPEVYPDGPEPGDRLNEVSPDKNEVLPDSPEVFPDSPESGDRPNEVSPDRNAVLQDRPVVFPDGPRLLGSGPADCRTKTGDCRMGCVSSDADFEGAAVTIQR